MAPFLFIDVKGLALSEDEKKCLQHPVVAGVVLFARNYDNPDQLFQLTSEIKLINSELAIAIDQEGGRVQRLRDSFTAIPPMGDFGAWYQEDPIETLELLHDTAWLVGAELKAMKIDINFAPVLDRDLGISEVIGDRAFDAEPRVIVELASQYIKGLMSAGVMPVGKHFPGHGAVVPDSHKALPVDARPYEDIAASDLAPFERLMASNQLPAVMMSHVVYSNVDQKPAGFSSQWVTEVLRNKLNYHGLVFTDDLSMEAARSCGTIVETVDQSLAAGCNMVLVCNYKQDLAGLLDVVASFSQKQAMQFKAPTAVSDDITWEALQVLPRYRSIKQILSERG